MNTFRNVKKEILTRVQSQVYRPGESIGSLRSMAKSFNTGVATVHRAIAELIAEGHLQLGPNRGYSVSATGHENGRDTVGILVSGSVGDMEHFAQAWKDAISVIQSGLSEQHKALLILAAGSLDPRKYPERFSPTAMAARRLGGLLVLGLYDASYLWEINAVQPGLVSLDLDASDLNVDSVIFDNVGSAAFLVKELAAHGARRIAYVSGQYPSSRDTRLKRNYDSCARERFDGWRAGMRAAGLSPDPELARFAPDRTESGMERAVRAMFDEGLKPDAIVCESPGAATKALAGVGNPSGRIPVAGWCDFLSGVPESVSLVAVCDFAELARQGLEVMTRRLAQPGGSVERRLVFPAVVNRLNRREPGGKA